METKTQISLDQDFFAIRTSNEDNIPLTYQNQSGEYGVLLFTSEARAKKWCYVRQPDAAKQIYKLDRGKKSDLEHVGLMRLAYTLRKFYDFIAWVIIDHPGGKGDAKFVSVGSLTDFIAKKSNVQSLDEWLIEQMSADKEGDS